MANNTTETNWSDISFESLSVKPTHKIGYGTVGQIIKGLSLITDGLKDTDAYQTDINTTMKFYATEIINKYNELFINDDNDNNENNDLYVNSIYGEHLNGKFNNGKLKNLVITPYIHKNSVYERVSFNQLITILVHRLKYIANKNIDNNDNYSEIYIETFNELQKRTKEFIAFLCENDDCIKTLWKEKINDIKTLHNKPIVKREYTKTTNNNYSETINNDIKNIKSVVVKPHMTNTTPNNNSTINKKSNNNTTNNKTIFKKQNNTTDNKKPNMTTTTGKKAIFKKQNNN
jgi:hypothetical protein